MTEDLVQRVREEYVQGPSQGAKKSGDDFDNGWKRWRDRIEENEAYKKNERAAKDERNVIERRSLAKKKDAA